MATTQTQPASSDSGSPATAPERLWPYLILGLALGIVFTRSEIISWFRIHEMFRFQSFHMYGIIGSAVAVGALGVQIIKRLDIRSRTGHPIRIPTERFEAPGWQFWLGGTVFGLGWGLLGACPGPIYVLIGNDITVMLVPLAAAIAGAWAYGALRHRLPHS